MAPYARRLFHQTGIPDVDEIDGIPPAVALQQQRGTRSSVGSVTTLGNLLRMPYSRAGDYSAWPAIICAEAPRGYTDTILLRYSGHDYNSERDPTPPADDPARQPRPLHR